MVAARVVRLCEGLIDNLSVVMSSTILVPRIQGCVEVSHHNGDPHNA